ncbi:MAG: recombinase family protein [Firmicutes bacterium]|nr:recombinase family protein [Bacillota bacterium]
MTNIQTQGTRTVRDYYQRGNAEIVKVQEKMKQLAAGYCRVSTKQDAQQDSYTHQVNFYTEYITSRSDEYEFVGVFADKGTSGLAMRRRKQFNKMVAMALEGKINIIFVKSISRYGRNVVDILSTTRQLREKGVTIVFEKEGINSSDPKCDVMLSILSTLSEDESRSISTNVKWYKDKQFEQGIVRINFNALYGYRGGGKGEVTVCPEEAEEVKGVFYKFLSGWSYADICRDLESRGCLTVRGKSDWDKTTVRGMLNQEKYMGDVLLKKTFKTDFMQLYPTKNKGQIPQKYVENNHLAIIDRETFAAAQAEIERRNGLRSSGTTGRGRYSGKFPFSNLIVCGECGFKFRRHTYRFNKTNPPRAEAVWTCYNHMQHGAERCTQLPVKEAYLEELFVRTLNGLLADRQAILDELEVIIAESVEETGGFDESQAYNIEAEIERLQSEIMELSKKRMSREIGQEEYREQTDNLKNRLDELFDERDSVTEVSGTAALEKAKLEAIRSFLQTEREQTEFAKDLPLRLLENVIIRNREDITFEFKNGLQVKATPDAPSVDVIIPENPAEGVPSPRAKFVR